MAMVGVAGTLLAMGLMGIVLIRVHRRDPNPRRRDPLSGALETYLPSRLADAGAMLGIRKLVVWGFFGVELAAGLLLELRPWLAAE